MASFSNSTCALPFDTVPLFRLAAALAFALLLFADPRASVLDGMIPVTDIALSMTFWMRARFRLVSVTSFVKGVVLLDALLLPLDRFLIGLHTSAVTSMD